jgi:hypothetical protein
MDRIGPRHGCTAARQRSRVPAKRRSGFSGPEAICSHDGATCAVARARTGLCARWVSAPIASSSARASRGRTPSANPSLPIATAGAAAVAHHGVPYRRRRRWGRCSSAGSSRAEPPPAGEWRSRRRRVRAKRRVSRDTSRRSARAATSSKHQKNTASANHPNTTYNHQPNVRAGYSRPLIGQVGARAARTSEHRSVSGCPGLPASLPRPGRLYTWGVNDGHRTMQRLRRAQAAFDAAAARAEATREERNMAVREALATGLTHAEIARATGLSRGRIGQIAQGSA